MSALVAVHGLVLYLAVAWKGINLSRAPHNRSLRWVTACLVCAALAYPAGIIVAARPASPAAPWLTFTELACLLGTGYALCCFFLFSLRGRSAARVQAWRRAVPVAIAIAILAVTAALTSAGPGMYDLRDPAVVVPYLTFDLCIAWLLADACMLSRQGARSSTGILARGLRIAAAGLALMVAGASFIAVYIVLRWARIGEPAALGQAGNLLVIPGVLVFLAGVCYPGAVMRLRAAGVWVRHRRAFRELGPLWTLLHQAFPEDRLARVPAGRRPALLSPHGVHWRYYRRVIECRDGLVRISPRLPQDDPAGAELASHLLAALASVATGPPAEGQAVPVAIPQTPHLDADADELIRLSRALPASTRVRIPRPRRETQASIPTERTPSP
jgi:hypothetical protein